MVVGGGCPLRQRTLNGVHDVGLDMPLGESPFDRLADDRPDLRGGLRRPEGNEDPEHVLAAYAVDADGTERPQHMPFEPLPPVLRDLVGAPARTVRVVGRRRLPERRHLGDALEGQRVAALVGERAMSRASASVTSG